MDVIIAAGLATAFPKTKSTPIDVIIAELATKFPKTKSTPIDVIIAGLATVSIHLIHGTMGPINGFIYTANGGAYYMIKYKNELCLVSEDIDYPTEHDLIKYTMDGLLDLVNSIKPVYVELHSVTNEQCVLNQFIHMTKKCEREWGNPDDIPLID